ncbi:MAG: glutamine--tRNA ligase/YqeY domain fusion protein [Myxococcota bacterium]
MTVFMTDRGSPPTEPGKDFIRAQIEQDVQEGKNDAHVVTRFPPEPNGFLHIGHSKAICLNFGVAQEMGGRCHLRFDDTNPLKEDTKYVEAIKEDVQWLGFDWGEHLYFASDYFDILYGYAEDLIRAGKAYVDSTSEEDMRRMRGTVTEPGTASPDRSRSVDENLDLFRRMRAGEFEDGAYVLRAKIDLAHPNMKMRDPPIYRIRRVAHHRTGDTWCIYPLYDFTHCLSDAQETITHSLCTLEFENNRALYDWFIEQLKTPSDPRQIEYARLELTYTLMSKRKLLELVEEGIVTGWDDPRMPTIAGLRRRGYRPEAIRTFAEKVGVARANSVVEFALLESVVRDDLNPIVPRVMGVLRPLKLVITNYPEDGEDVFDAPRFPDEPEKMGRRPVPFSRELWIEASDFMEDPPKKYFRLSPGREVRLRWAYLVTCTGVVKNEAGEVVEVHATYDPESRGGTPADGRKVKGTIHWVSAKHALEAEVRLYDHLFSVERPGQAEDWRQELNPNSLEVVRAQLEPSLKSAGPSERFQFERTAFFFTDPVDSAPGAPVFNRIVSLRDSWKKIAKKGAK